MRLTNAAPVPPWNGWRAQKVVAEQRRIHAHRNTPCWICGQPIDYTLGPNDAMRFSVDHVQPRSIRPDLTWDPSNWAAAHMRCNKARGNRTPDTQGATSREW
jgi:5-methylcytosine-specific restriction endonuclease McrA